METFGSLKRRTTDLVSNINLPSELPKVAKPTMPSLPSVNFPSLASLSSHLPQATWERIDLPPLARSSHSINIVSGNAYVFGGEVEARKPVDNDTHVIVLPYSSAGADYYAVRAKPAARPPIPTVVEHAASDHGDDVMQKDKDLSEVSLSEPAAAPHEAHASSSSSNSGATASGELGDVPSPRVGHATAVIGTRIFLFGGRGGPDMAPLQERGRVWVFDTKTHLWSYLDPDMPLPAAHDDEPAYADTRRFYPAPRSYHAAAAVDLPREFGTAAPPGHAPAATAAGPPGRALKRTTTWTEWAQGDSDMVGTPQRPIVGNVANNSRDEDEDGYGTLLIHGGCFAAGRANDTWAFDVRSRVWQELPSAPGPPRGGASIAVAAGRLYRFGGFNGESEEGGQLDYLELGVDASRHEVTLRAKDGWKSIPAPPALLASTSSLEGEAEGEAAPINTAMSASTSTWPGHRSVAGFQAVTIGGPQGRQYLLLTLGERDPSADGHEAAGQFWADTWAYELPRAGYTVTSAADHVRGLVGSAAAEGKWFRVETDAYDDEDDVAAQGPGPRGWFASAAMGELDERGLVLWGGVDGSNARLGDGWILRIGGDKREA
ncbi:hypothetical protein BD289DRAFT_378684 [Coniella lustricola]|uniref:Kelch domain-containing protein n=1 Tax=Coniella lustricola TaxID=2025994 RepID=A0A2T2ZTQ5_9PEZI|nr:hypothetical protein BD289DRAFT_378684 [Coniella lustricola]